MSHNETYQFFDHISYYHENQNVLEKYNEISLRRKETGDKKRFAWIHYLKYGKKKIARKIQSRTKK